RRSLQTIADASKGLAREVDGLLLLARGDAASPRRTEELDLSDVAEEARAATSSVPSRAAATRACAASGRGCSGWFRTSSPTPSSIRTPATWSSFRSR